MAEIIFYYNGKEIKEICSKEEKLKEIFSRFGTKAQTSIKNKYFLYNGDNITKNEDLSFIEIATSLDKENNHMKILVYDGFDEKCHYNPKIKNNESNKEDYYTKLLRKIELIEDRLDKIEIIEDRLDILEKDKIYQGDKKGKLLEEIKQKLDIEAKIKNFFDAENIKIKFEKFDENFLQNINI